MQEDFTENEVIEYIESILTPQLECYKAMIKIMKLKNAHIVLYLPNGSVGIGIRASIIFKYSDFVYGMNKLPLYGEQEDNSENMLLELLDASDDGAKTIAKASVCIDKKYLKGQRINKNKMNKYSIITKDLKKIIDKYGSKNENKVKND